MKKLFIVRKYIWAKDAKEAIAKEQKAPVDDVWVDEDWKKSSTNGKPMGFHKPK